ncbi:MAG TPA: iron-sulfur cluster repair di-iron protein [Chitinophagaceae bacterium]
MTELANQTLAQIVTDNHRTAAVFEKYHLDFCCKGKRSLQQACDEQNIAVDKLLNELNTVSPGSSGSCQVAFPFDKLSLSQLTSYITSTHHSYVKNELPQLLGYSQKLASKHGKQHQELLKIFELLVAIKEEMDLHMQKEERVLFPRINEIEKLSQQPEANYKLNISYLQAPVTLMEQEHDHAGALTEEIRNLSNNYETPADGCTTYKLMYASLKAFEMDLHQHVHLENNILFPKAIALAKNISETTLN